MSRGPKPNWWRWGAVVALILLIVYCLLRLSDRPIQVERIEDASQAVELTLVLTDMYQPRPVSGISIWLVGEIDGEGEISIGGSTRIKVVGKVDRHISIDWFDMRCDVRYVPITAKSGSIEVRYRFHN